MNLFRLFAPALLAAVSGSFAISAAPANHAVFTATSNTLTNLLEGVFSSSNITVDDLAAQYESTGPAVCFQGDNFLKKAGGVAAAAAIESKLEPYYKQYGLTGTTLVINADATFEMKIKHLKLTGTITQAEEKGVFNFNFQAFGKMKVGSLKTYIQKSGTSIDVMFDATKMKGLISTIAKFSGMSMAKTLSSLLDQYDGLCVGFKFSKTGSVEGAKESASSSIGSALGNILGGGNKNQNSTDETKPAGDNTNSQSESTKTGTDLLKEILKKGK